MKLIDRCKVITVTILLTLSPFFGLFRSAAHEKGVAQAVTSSDQKAVADQLGKEGMQKYRQGEVKEALPYFEKALVIFKALKDVKGEARTLNNIGLVYSALGEKQKALEFYNLSLPLSRAVGDHTQEATTLNNIGLVYSALGEKQKALEFYNLSLLLSRAVGNRALEAVAFSGIGLVYNALGERQKALEYLNLSLSLSRAVGNRALEAVAFSGIGLIYSALGEKQKALEFYNLSLPLSRAVGNRALEAATLSNIGLVYNALGEKKKALEYLNLSLPVSRAVGDHALEATTLNNIGGVYDALGEKQKALEFFNLSLPLRRAIGDRTGEATTLNNIGCIYFDLGENQKTLDYFNQSLPLLRAVGDRTGEAVTLNNIGSVYFALGENQKALDYFNQSLPLTHAVGDRAGEAITLSWFGWVLSKQKQPELAIVFFKQSVNITESLRKDIKGLPKALQQTYAQSVSASYRTLANLLLKQDRILEAQQVLDLLKVQELEDYLRNVRGTPQSQQGVVVLRAEQQILDQFNAKQQSAIQLGQELTQLQALAKAKPLTPAQEKRQAELDTLLTTLKSQFNQFINSPQIQQYIAQLTHADQQQIPLNVFDKLRSNLSKMSGNAVLLYPLILDDRIELIITTPASPPLRRTVPVKRTELNQAIQDYRSALETPNLDAKPLAQKLYRWLIQPLEADLKQANAQTILYAPDGPLRYIPLAALHDGNQWLAQRYSINNITAASLSELSANPPAPLRIMAGAFANKKLSYSIQVGQQNLVFNGLSFAGREVENLVASIPNTAPFLDQAFSLKALKPRFGDYSILHFATHAAFFPGQPEDSFILFGDGDRASLRSIANWSLSGVDLVVLSACETGVGIEAAPHTPKPQTQKLGDGVEVLGLGYQFQQVGARATIASLWSVDDGGTQVLMSTFYALLQKGNISKAEALRQAQAALITANLKALDGQDRGLALTVKNAALAQTVIKRLDHPHYWAPFILIGNGL